MHHLHSWAFLFGGVLGLLLMALHWWWEKWQKIELDGVKISIQIVSCGVCIGLLTIISIPLLVPPENADEVAWNIGAILLTCLTVVQLGYAFRLRRRKRRRLRT